MAKNKPNTIAHYELLYIVSNKYSEEELKPITERVTKIITDRGGEITYSEDWGKRKFAYTIDHFKHGYYQLVEFDLESGLDRINRNLQMDSDILRHMIVAKRKRSAEEIAQEKKEKTKPQPETKPEKPVEDKKPEKKEEKVDMEQLDQKLDKILETDDLF
jgi:small subunit ribosomal protein S6